MLNKTLKTTNNKTISLALLVLRIGMGAMMLTHGLPKFMKIIAGDMSFGDPIGLGEGLSLILAVLGEFVGSIFVILGFYTRIATVPLIGVMVTAAFVVHGTDPFGQKEKALLYLVAFIAILIAGAGRYSIDKRLRK